MIRLRMAILFLLIVISLVGCNSKVSSKSEEQQQAVNNCIEFIKNSSFESKDRIDTNIIKIKTVKESTLESALVNDPKLKEAGIDPTDWIITIGDTTFHDFAIFICDSSTYKVLDYIPIK